MFVKMTDEEEEESKVKPAETKPAETAKPKESIIVVKQN